jgi:hypothetical protein
MNTRLRRSMHAHARGPLRRRLTTSLAVVVAAGLMWGSALAQNSTNASTKAAAAITTVTMCAESTTGPIGPCTTPTGPNWLPVMSTQIKTSNVADLFVGVSLVTGLYTHTQVKGSTTGTTTGSQAVASGTVAVRVLLDGNIWGAGVLPASAPDPATGSVGVIFDQRIQTLNATLGSVFTGTTCTTGCTLTPEQVTLILQTASAHSFNFILPEVGVGTHTTEVEAALSTGTTGTTPGNVAIADALFGLGSLTVEAVRLNDAVFSF